MLQDGGLLLELLLFVILIFPVELQSIVPKIHHYIVKLMLVGLILEVINKNYLTTWEPILPKCLIFS